MQVIFADQAARIEAPSIFLAGPTPRSTAVRSWRPDALRVLEVLGFTGTVLVPERQDWAALTNYIDQVEWEFAGLEACSVIAFWIPRDLETLPAFTSNVEFGRYVGSGRCVYGRPPNAPKTRYLDWFYRKLTRRDPQETLQATMFAALRHVAGQGNEFDKDQ